MGESQPGRPEKQQRNLMYSLKLDWENDRRAPRRQRRETAWDWLMVALSSLKEGRDYLEKYGVAGVFAQEYCEAGGTELC